MCLAVIALDAHPRFAVVIAANRDEFHARAAERAYWWNDEAGRPLLAGRDLAQRGTWLGVNRSGRWAFVTNVREPGCYDPDAPSRGALVPRVLRDTHAAATAVERIAASTHGYNGFNLVGGDASTATFASNRGLRSLPLSAGVSGLSNAGLDTPWPKLVRAKAGMAKWLRNASDDLHALFPVLRDRSMATDADLPDTGLSPERERLLSSPFIVSDEYGTRCSTIVAIARDGVVQFIERSFDASGAVTGDVEFSFRSDAMQYSGV